MHSIPYNLFNHILVNARFHVFNLNEGFDITFSFYEYVKSQMHFPLVVYLNNRSPEDYKKVYLYLTSEDKSVYSSLDGGYNEVLDSITKVVKYFYKDISNSLANIGARGNFNLDLNCLESLGIEFQSLDGDFNEKILKVNKSSVSNDLILWR